MGRYVFKFLTSKDLRFLPQVTEFFDDLSVSAWVDQKTGEFSRLSSDGFITLLGSVENQPVGVIYNDFRVRGGSFGKEPSKRTQAFIDYLTEKKIPLIFVLNTIGIRFMEGRTVFEHAFNLIPSLTRFAQSLPMFTISAGRTIGLGAVIFRLGCYRIGIKDHCEINLTGPEVIRTFFGDNVDFKSIARGEVLFKNTSLIHEMSDSVSAAFQKVKTLLLMSKKENFSKELNFDLETASDYKTQKILKHFNGPKLEIFRELDYVVRTFLVQHDGIPMGVFINPLGQVNNVVSVATLKKYQSALEFFKFLNLPVASFLDTAGADPRIVKTGDNDIITELAITAGKIIDYPHSMMGFCVGRCFGGANILGFPKIFGAMAVYAVEGAQMGIMHPQLITKVLQGSPRLLEQWKKASETEVSDLSDLIREGTIDSIIEEKQISDKLSLFLMITQLEKQAVELEPQAIAQTSMPQLEKLL